MWSLSHEAILLKNVDFLRRVLAARDFERYLETNKILKQIHNSFKVVLLNLIFFSSILRTRLISMLKCRSFDNFHVNSIKDMGIRFMASLCQKFVSF